jgi:1-acyl-sn-glycerol-3-phosphate acyltransferase
VTLSDGERALAGLAELYDSVTTRAIVRTETARKKQGKELQNDETRWAAKPSPWMIATAVPLVRALMRLHPTTIDGECNIPDGPAILVGNHGLFGYESPLFFERLLALRGTIPIGLADRGFFKVPGVRSMLVRLGGAYGNAANGLQALAEGRIVVCYPGGVREVYKSEHEKYKLLWQDRDGYIRLALSAGVPIVPFAAAGIDHIFKVVGHLPGTGALFMGSSKYNFPLFWGRNGVLPESVPFWFRFGAAIQIAAPNGGEPHDGTLVQKLHAQVWKSTQTLLDDLMEAWTNKFKDHKSVV